MVKLFLMLVQTTQEEGTIFYIIKRNIIRIMCLLRCILDQKYSYEVITQLYTDQEISLAIFAFKKEKIIFFFRKCFWTLFLENVEV